MTAVYKSKAGLSFWSLERRPDCHLSPWSVRPLGLQVQGPIVIWVLGEPALRGSTGRRSDCHFGPWREGPIVILVLGERARLSFWSLERRPDCHFGPWREGPIVILVLGEPALRGSAGPRPSCHLGPWSVRPLGLQVQGLIVIWVLGEMARLSFGSLECQALGSTGLRPDCHLGPWSVRPLGLQVQGPTVIWVLGVSGPWVYRSMARLSFWSLESQLSGDLQVKDPDCHLGPWSVRPLGLQVQGPAVSLVLGSAAPRVYRSTVQ